MLLIKPTENLDITFIGEFLSDKSGTANSRNFVNNDALRRTQLFGYTPPEDRYEINHNLMGGNDLEIDTFIGEFNFILALFLMAELCICLINAFIPPSGIKEEKTLPLEKIC